MRFSVLFIFLLICAATVTATTIGSDVPYDNRFVIFKPGAETSFAFSVGQARSVEAYIEADELLKPYVTLIDPQPGGGDRTVTVKIKFGNTLPPGEHTIHVGARELPPPGVKGIRTTTTVQTSIRVFSLSSEKSIRGSLEISDVNEGENVSFIVYVQSWTYQDITSVYADIDVEDTSNKKVATVRTNEIFLKSEERTSVSGVLDTQNMTPGVYNAKATIFYDGQAIVSRGTFKIGTLKVEVVSHTKELQAETLNKFEMNVQSNWNEPLENLYGEITLAGKTERTPNINLEKFGDGVLSTYINTREAKTGEQPIKMKLFYAKKSSETTGQVRIVQPLEPLIEKPVEVKPSFNYLYIALILLVVVNIILLWRRKKSKSEPQGTQTGRVEKFK